MLFFFNDPPTPEIYPLSLHDALPISLAPGPAALHGSVPAQRHVVVPGESCAADRKSTRLNSSHPSISYAVFCLKKKNVLYLSCALISGHLAMMLMKVTKRR